MYVGIISDTHGVFSDGFRKFLEPVDVVWHAGDFGGGIGFAEQLAAFKPLIGVYGNCDGQDIRLEYPESKFIEAEGLRVLLKHIGGSPGHYDKDARVLLDAYHPDVFVCGHSGLGCGAHRPARQARRRTPARHGGLPASQVLLTFLFSGSSFSLTSTLAWSFSCVLSVSMTEVFL